MMDRFPAHLSPIIDEPSKAKTSFNEWWPKVKSSFPTVPDIIAKDWLYRHWGTSPFGWIPSRSYRFTMEKLPADELPNVLNRVFQFEADNLRALDTGRHICGDHPGVPNRPWSRDPVWLLAYMRQHGNFPSPITILDNRDNHLKTMPNISDRIRGYPQGLLLAEGHTRHVIGLYLRSIGQFNDAVPICRLTFHSMAPDAPLPH